MEEANQPKIGRIKKGWLLTKGAWRVLKLDKELINIPLISAIVQLVLFTVFVVIGFLIANYFGVFDTVATTDTTNETEVPFWVYLAVLPALIILDFVVNYFSAALIAGAFMRFRGDDPTVKGSLAAVKGKSLAIFQFTFLQAVVFTILDFIEQKVPLGGKIAAWLAGVAFRVASFFVLPIIVDTKQHIGPWKATKQSAGLIKQVWGESLVVAVGINIIGVLTAFLYLAVMAALFAAGISLSAPVALAWAGGVLTIVGLMALVLIFATLSSIAQAAIYHYATTGDSPLEFDKKLLKQALTPKKARRIFG